VKQGSCLGNIQLRNFPAFKLCINNSQCALLYDYVASHYFNPVFHGADNHIGGGNLPCQHHQQAVIAGEGCCQACLRRLDGICPKNPFP